MELDGIIIDYSKDGKIVAIEILDAGKRTKEGEYAKIDERHLAYPRVKEQREPYYNDEEIDWPDEPKILLWRRGRQWKDETLKGGIR